MTSVFFVRHAQPDITHADDRSRPLTALGREDTKRVTEALIGKQIGVIYSSPYKRSRDTILHFANTVNMRIRTDERLRERHVGPDAGGLLEKRWKDFDFHEAGGESLGAVQRRNIEALLEIIGEHPNQNIAVATHGTALSTIINYFEPSFQCDDFNRILNYLPYILRIDFEDGKMVGKEEVLILDRGYQVP